MRDCFHVSTDRDSSLLGITPCRLVTGLLILHGEIGVGYLVRPKRRKVFSSLHDVKGPRDSVVGVPTGYGLDDSWIESWWERDTCNTVGSLCRT